MKLERITWGLLYPPKESSVWGKFQTSRLCELAAVCAAGVTSDVVSVCWNVTLCPWAIGFRLLGSEVCHHLEGVCIVHA